jgi:hypothetical protein
MNVFTQYLGKVPKHSLQHWSLNHTCKNNNHVGIVDDITMNPKWIYRISNLLIISQ